MPAKRKKLVTPDLRIKKITPQGGKAQERHVLHPGGIAKVELHKQFDVPKMRTGLPHPAHPTTRSILARLGVEALNHTDEMLEHAHVTPKLRVTGKTPKHVMLLHQGKIPVRLRRGNRIVRMMFPHAVEPVRKREIKSLMEKGELKLGKDCKIHESGLIEISVRPVVYEIPEEKIAELAKVNWMTGSKRKELMSHLKRLRAMPRTTPRHVVLTETEPVKLPDDAALVFQRMTDGTSVHIQSHFIDPGFEGPIVMELMGFAEGAAPDTVLAWLVRPEQ